MDAREGCSSAASRRRVSISASALIAAPAASPPSFRAADVSTYKILVWETETMLAQGQALTRSTAAAQNPVVSKSYAVTAVAVPIGPVYAGISPRRAAAS